MDELLPSPWDWVPSRELVLTRAHGVSVRFTPSNPSAKFSATNWEVRAKIVCSQVTHMGGFYLHTGRIQFRGHLSSMQS